MMVFNNNNNIIIIIIIIIITLTFQVASPVRIGSSSLIKLSGTCCCWIESIIPSTRETTDPVDCVVDCVHNNLLGGD